MAVEEGKYNIKAVSTMVGIQPGTMRAWERRYQIIEPVRNESGHRLYTDEHVRKLKWLVNKVNAGFTISQAVVLLEQNKESYKDPANGLQDRVEMYQDDLIEALLRFDESKSHELINQAFSLYTIDKVLIDILGSVLVRIGRLWEEKKITTAHEHFATSILRSRIGILMHSFPHNGLLPKVVAVCAPGEWHELGLLIFTLYVRRKGFEVIYLGTSIKEGDIDIVLETVEPSFLFLSCTLTDNLPKALSLIDRLKKEHKKLSIGIGGFAVDSLQSDERKSYSNHIVGITKDDWEQWLMDRV
ncbi:MerR family transcriptional regulator [Jeotgalibacillus proteolyticus]|uniref:MerR family transcriptional regulator n=1 Tax=Jeotgalibacillus proteolyticus TaxID=2082395 RepID=A0A2S5GEF3_9BACL|nr:B12-binding domain-containing protein [Jeotgalibacillus proteolyticus]PPA71284.1 MerR family transcriptional regulator [Jeotgalibacillus proteolyticus]